MNSKAIGSRIKGARELKGLTQEQLADISGISTSHISVVERGVKSIKLETLVRIANALHVTADSLLIDVLNTSLQTSATKLSIKIEKLPPKDQRKILKVVDVMIGD